MQEDTHCVDNGLEKKSSQFIVDVRLTHTVGLIFQAGYD